MAAWPCQLRSELPEQDNQTAMHMPSFVTEGGHFVIYSGSRALICSTLSICPDCLRKVLTFAACYFLLGCLWKPYAHPKS